MMERAWVNLQTSQPLSSDRWFCTTVQACTFVLGSLLLLSLVNCGGQDSTPVPPSGNSPTNSPAKLTDLTLSSGQLNPAFDPLVTNYSTILSGVDSLILTPTAPGQIITVNGTPVLSGSPSVPIALPLGTSTITILVTSTTGQTQTYALTAQRVAPASLTGLTLSGGRLNPAFDPSVTNYSTMFIEANSLTLTPTAPGQTITVNGLPVVSGSPSGPITLPPGTSDIIIVVTSTAGQAQTYTVVAHQLAQEAYAKASNTSAADQFGLSAAIDGDTLVVGAPFEDSDATGVNGNQNSSSAGNSGAVYVFTRTGAAWTQQAYIKAFNTGAGDEFGTSVALDGDTLVVGAYREDSNGTGVNSGAETDNSASDSGAVYVFTRNGTVWTQQAYIKASNTDANDQFGFSVAISNDTLAVGALLEDSNATGVDGDEANNSTSGSGAVYVFARTGTTWTQQAYIKASNTGSGDWFGITVALNGDTLAVGANREDSNGIGVDSGVEGNNSASDSGAVYVFTRIGTLWTQQAYVKAFNTSSGDEFGRRVALDGDTLAVGAYREDSNGIGINSGAEADDTVMDSGAVYVFTRTGPTWTQQAYIKASNADAHNRLGFSIALSGDTLVAGSSGEDSASTGVGGNQVPNPPAWASGAAYIFTRIGTTWTQQAYVKASNTGGALTAQDSSGNELFGDQFGVIVAVDGDTVAVGASTEDSNGTGVNGGAEADNNALNSGAVYVLR